jgi:hypothetical protein
MIKERQFLHHPYDVGCPASLARPRRLVVYADSMQRPSAKRNGRLLAPKLNEKRAHVMACFFPLLLTCIYI